MDPIDSKIKNYLADSENENVPQDLLAKAKAIFPGRAERLSCPHCGKGITPFKDPLTKQKRKNALWMFLAVASFGGSFLAPRYFFQFLAAFLFFSFRWIVDQRATKTQIFVYKTLTDRESTQAQGRDGSTFAHHPEQDA